MVIDFNVDDSKNALIGLNGPWNDCSASGMSGTTLYVIAITASFLLMIMSLILYKRNKEMYNQIEQMEAEAQNEKAQKADQFADPIKVGEISIDANKKLFESASSLVAGEAEKA